MKVFISSIPFALGNKKPLEKLLISKIDFDINPYGRKIKEDELKKIIHKYDAIIAGTERINANVLRKAKNLKLIARLGVGVSNIDLAFAKKNNIIVTYTPLAPSQSVAELTLGFIISLARGIHKNNIKMHNHEWKKIMGNELSDLTIGIMGYGRIGSIVHKLLRKIGVKKIIVFEKNKKIREKNKNINFVDIDSIYSLSDVISLHLSSNKDTIEIINSKSILKMKSGTMIVNTSRGDLINENDLYKNLKSGHLGGAALDVFNDEPYNGKLSKFDNCILTSHIGSLTQRSRNAMEMLAVEEILRFKLSRKQLFKFT